ncbi:MAG: VOC family protein [Nocardioidaceae bacterium]
MTSPRTDPWSTLALPLLPVAPSPAFAARLRTDLSRALGLPRGVAMSDLTDETELTAVDPSGGPRPAAIPYLSVLDARAALSWYEQVFDAQLVGDAIAMPDGRIGHSEVRIGPGVFYLSDAHPEIGVVAPTPGETAVSLVLHVDDADRVLAAAEAAGARRDRDPYDGYGLRNAWMVDPFGHRWLLSGPVR